VGAQVRGGDGLLLISESPVFPRGGYWAATEHQWRGESVLVRADTSHPAAVPIRRRARTIILGVIKNA
jgi:hypothetical protein